MLLVLPARYSRGILPLTTPELNQNILFLIEKIILILSYSIEIIEILIL
jgi:hypothetical protein